MGLHMERFENLLNWLDIYQPNSNFRASLLINDTCLFYDDNTNKLKQFVFDLNRIGLHMLTFV